MPRTHLARCSTRIAPVTAGVASAASALARSVSARSLSALALWVGAVGLTSCGPDPDSLRAVADGKSVVTGEGVLLIVVDGLRWDHTSLSGYDRNTTPFLLRFAQKSIVFENAWSPTSSQLGAHVAILSGCDPSIAQAPPAFGASSGALESAATSDSTAWFLPDELTLISQPFLGAGWHTAAFVDDPMIAELRGFDRGFREFIEFGGEPGNTEREIGVFGVGRRFVKWLNDQSISDNWFAYVHMNDLERVWVEGEDTLAFPDIEPRTKHWTPRPELDRVPPLGYSEPLLHTLPPSRAGTGEPLSLAQYELRYDRGIRAIDLSLERLLGYAGEYKRDELMTVVIVGSFGTGLGENGMYLRAGLATDEDLHVPLIIKPSKRLAESLGLTSPDGSTGSGVGFGRTASMASSIDLMPTLVELLGLRGPGGLHGVSQVPVLKDRRKEVRSRVFATSTVIPGDAIIDRKGLFARYSSGAGPGIGLSLGPGAVEGGPNTGYWEYWVPRGRDLDAKPGVAGKRAVLDRWKTLVLAERTAIHFGGGSADTTNAEKIVGLQVPPGGPRKDH